MRPSRRPHLQGGAFPVRSAEDAAFHFDPPLPRIQSAVLGRNQVIQGASPVRNAC